MSFVSASLRRLAAVAVLATTGLITGCSAAEDAATDELDTIHHTATLNGTWQGKDGSSGPAVATVEQRGLSVTATLVLQNHRCVERVVIQGVVDKDGMSGRADVGAMHVHFGSKADLSELLADYESVQDGPCPGDSGNVRLIR